MFVFVQDTEYHSAQGPGYSKFQRDTYIHQKHAGRTITMKIDANGFRGSRDFSNQKDFDGCRVATLGGSSTFGYYVEENETYPGVLEQMFQRAQPGKHVQVLNLGIPHAKMENIVEFAKVELPNLHPDIIILYAGYNDATHPKDSRSVSNLYKLREWLYLHSVLWRTLHSALKTLY